MVLKPNNDISSFLESILHVISSMAHLLVSNLFFVFVFLRLILVNSFVWFYFLRPLHDAPQAP